MRQGRRSTGRPGSGDRRWGRRLPVVLLLLSLGVAALGGLDAFRAQRSHAATATDLLRDYSEFAAWSYERASWELLRSALEDHLAPVYTNPRFRQGHATRECLATMLQPVRSRHCPDCPPPLAGAYSFFTRLDRSASETEWGGRPPAGPLRTSLVEATRTHARSAYGDDWTFAVFHMGDVPDAPVVAYTLVESSARIDRDMEVRRDTLLFGFEVDRERLAALYARTMESEVLLPPTLTRERRNGDVISVQVYGPDDALLYGSGPAGEMVFAAPVDRQEIFGGGEIHASVLPSVASELIIGGLPGDRTGILVLVFSLAGALAVLALVQLRREDQLALLRQDFVASVSHELRTPLAQVRLFTETLRLGRTTDPEQETWALESIDRETLRLSNLVENILHFSRSERGVANLDREPADLATAVRDAITSFRPLMPAKKGCIVDDLPEALPADLHRDSIRQVVLNLLDNAVRYGRAGQTIRVTGTRAQDAVRIVVEDEGPGVPVDERDRIFEPFHRGAKSVGSVVVGSGIGLAVVRQIVEAHDGRIWVEDAPSGGARFVFELPRQHTAVPEHFARSEEIEDRAVRTGAA